MSPRTNYQLSQSQVNTPHEVVSFFWELLQQYRPKIEHVLDLGAGDGRFAVGTGYQKYTGIEIDESRTPKQGRVAGGRVSIGCAFAHKNSDYDACIGNPPYVRHHDIEVNWKLRTLGVLGEYIKGKLDGHANLYIYFLILAIMKTSSAGIVAQIVPFEWVSRPSAEALRHYLHKNGWQVDIYRFQKKIFNRVSTTACVTIIDKSRQSSGWNYFDVTANFAIKRRLGITGSRKELIPHSQRGTLWGRRGISPGSQKIFTLTEGERIHAGLTLSDVVPCVTTLRNLPYSVKILDKNVFSRHFIQTAQKCWLIKSNSHRLSDRLKRYLSSIPYEARNNYTCKNQDPWYNYENVPISDLLIQSGFVEKSPRVLINKIGAQAVGSVYGIHTDQKSSKIRLREYLAELDIGSMVALQSPYLRKIEVGQLNTLLNEWKSTNE